MRRQAWIEAVACYVVYRCTRRGAELLDWVYIFTYRRGTHDRMIIIYNPSLIILRPGPW